MINGYDAEFKSEADGVITKIVNFEIEFEKVKFINRHFQEKRGFEEQKEIIKFTTNECLPENKETKYSLNFTVFNNNGSEQRIEIKLIEINNDGSITVYWPCGRTINPIDIR